MQFHGHPCSWEPKARAPQLVLEWLCPWLG